MGHSEAVHASRYLIEERAENKLAHLLGSGTSIRAATRSKGQWEPPPSLRLRQNLPYLPG